MIPDFVVRTVVWIAAIGLWAGLHRPSSGWVPEWTGAASAIGWAIVLAGAWLYTVSALAVARINRDPSGTPTRLLVRGPYRVVRNPLYLGIILIVVGLTAVYRAWQPSALARTALLFVLGHLAVVYLEEPGVRRRFGADYDAYCRRVPRWLPRPGRSI
jgi:protein-S-isoprenylcysteine O-methyltransferase Ste14